VRAYSSNVAFEKWRSRIIGSAALQESAGNDGCVGAKRGARRRCFETKRGGRRGRDAATEDKEVITSFAATQTFHMPSESSARLQECVAAVQISCTAAAAVCDSGGGRRGGDGRGG
jgi:hypothetical protein